MDPLLKELASYGIYGKPLNEIPEEVIEKMVSSNLGEIRSVDDIEKLHKSVFTQDLGTDYKKDKNISEILSLDPPDKYFIRLKTEEWHKFVLRNLNSKFEPYYRIISEFIVAGGVLTRQDVEDRLNISGVDSKVGFRRLAVLRDHGLIAEEMSGDEKLYIYKWSGGPVKEARSKQKIQNKSKEGVVQSSMHESSDESTLIQNGKSAVNEKNLTVNGNNLTVNENQLTSQLTNQIIEFISNKKVFIINEIKEEIKYLIETTFKNEDEELANFLESQGWKIIEISSKYIPMEYVAYISTLEENDPLLLKKIEQAQSRIVCAFRRRILKHFCTNQRGNIEDNGYLFALSGRIDAFYTFMMRELPKRNNQVFFGRNMIMEMDFLTFTACVPLRHENLLLAVAAFSLEESCRDGESPRNEFSDFLEGGVSDPATVYSKARAVVEPLKLLDAVMLLNSPPSESIAMQFPQHKSCAVEIINKATPGEFREILEAVIKHNIFEPFENGGFIFFSVIDNVDDYVKTLLSKLSAKERAYQTDYLTREMRNKLFHDLCEFSQEEFVERAREVISKLPSKNVRKSLYKKLQGFN